MNQAQLAELAFFVRGSFGMLLGNGDGTFRFGTQGEIGDGLLYVADFNRDGRSDLALLHGGCWMIQKVAYGKPTSLCRSTSLRVFLARADGSFEDPIETSGIEVTGVLVADVNHDGFPDIAAVVDNGSAPSSPVVLPGNGDGTFRVPRRIATEYDTLPVGAADLDGDSNLDLVLMGRDADGGNGISAQVSGRTWYFALWETVDRRVGGITDFDGDGRPDLVTAVYAIDCASRSGSPCSDQSNRITVLLNRSEAAAR